MKNIIPALLLCLLLTGCINQDQADVKMGKGCIAGINSLLKMDNKVLETVKSKRYASEDTEGGLHRRIIIEGVEKDGWLELDKSYSCLFMQEWGLFKSSHRSLLVQIKTDSKLIGKKDNVIQGSIADFAAVSLAVDAAMSK